MLSLLLLACSGAADPEVIPLSTREDSYGWAGYRFTVFALSDPSLETPDGEAPRFHVLAPVDPGEAPRPVLLFLHGGSLDTDAEDPAGEAGYCGSAYAAETVSEQLKNSALAQQAVDLGWIVVVPEDAYCDGWVGRGDRDPVDTGHAGFALACRALEWLLYEQEDWPVDRQRVHLVGSSMGAMGAAWFASQTAIPLAGAGFAHGSTDTTRLYYEEGYNSDPPEAWQGRFDHVFGGPPYLDGPGSAPSPQYPSYRANSLALAVSEGDLELPIFHLWSSRDPVSLAVAHEGMAELLATRGDIPWGDYDTGVRYHSVIHSLRYPYATLALLRFLDRRGEVAVLEGEAGEGKVGEASEDAEAWALMSGTAVRESAEPGLLYRQRLSPPAGSSFRATFFLSAGGEVQITLRASDGAGVIDSAVLGAEDLSYPDRDYPGLREVLAATTLAGTARGELTLEVLTEGRGEVALDVILVD